MKVIEVAVFLFKPILGFHCHAIEKKNQNHSMNEVKKLTWYRG